MSNPISKANEDYYLPFCEIYNKDTSEKYRKSSLQKVNAFILSSTTIVINSLGANGMSFSLWAQYAKNVHILVKCIEYNRPQALYSQHWLNSEKENLLKNFIETIDYTCSTIFYGISDLTKINSPILNADVGYITCSPWLPFQMELLGEAVSHDTDKSKELGKQKPIWQDPSKEVAKIFGGATKTRILDRSQRTKRRPQGQGLPTWPPNRINPSEPTGLEVWENGEGPVEK
ncbi:hypothetical protein C2G38_2201690 [Gigaspora rosea]|uniref:Uncharacterized protein n=1 Tax=Gigaspora rosea TaxID=44941 RepID=A0A397UP92_9GLOM|nr:hypothetical protein C2G38_2201690 [Gigaspora rosea]